MKADQVGMLPIYIGAKGEENQGLTTGSENYLCINAKASEADQKASKDFLNWVVTSDEGIKALSEDMGFTTPFKTFDKVKSDNPLVEEAVEDSNSGKQQVAQLHDDAVGGVEEPARLYHARLRAGQRQLG